MASSIPLQQTLHLLDTQDRLLDVDRARPAPSDLAAHLLTISENQGLPMTQADADRVVKASLAEIHNGSTISMKERPTTRLAWKDLQSAARKKLDESRAKRDPLRKKANRLSTIMTVVGCIGMAAFAGMGEGLSITHAAPTWVIFSSLFMALLFFGLNVSGAEILTRWTGLDQRLKDAEDQVSKDGLDLQRWMDASGQITLDKLSDWVKIPGMAAVLHAIFQSDVPFLGQDHAFLQERFHEHQITHAHELATERNRQAQQKATERNSEHLAFLRQQMVREFSNTTAESNATSPNALGS